MDKNGNLILTGWGYAEYVASAAVALKALGGRADVYGVSRNTMKKYLQGVIVFCFPQRFERRRVRGVVLCDFSQRLEKGDVNE